MLRRVKQLQYMCVRWIPSVKHNNAGCLHKTISDCSLLMDMYVTDNKADAQESSQRAEMDMSDNEYT